MKPNETKPARRQFLIGATLGTAATAAVVITGKTQQQVTEDVANAALTSKETSGYRLTPHIAQYYDTTKI
jgi:hypothetical protein